MSEANRKLLIIVTVFVVFAVLLFGWPTPYRYIVLQRSAGCGGDACTVVVRINRITGTMKWTDGRGWFPRDVEAGGTQ